VTHSKPLARALTWLLLLAIGVSVGCKKKGASIQERTSAITQSGSAENSLPKDIFGPDAVPGATILKPIDPKTLSETEIKFGIAPQRTNDVEYQPDVIVMEQGDRAIRSVASDGMTWKFDANAPHANEFQEGKIVFATSRAVGRILSLTREGDSISAILGPVQLTDLIANGKFKIDSPIDLDNMISYVSPDFPQAPDPNPEAKTSSLDTPGNRLSETVIVSKVSPDGVWRPASMAHIYADGRRVTYRREGHFWTEPRLSLANVSRDYLARSFSPIPMSPEPLLAQQVTPGIPQLPHAPTIPDVTLPPARTTGPPPVVNLSGGKATGIAGKSGIGVQYIFNQNGLAISAYSLIGIQNAGLGFVLDIQKGKIVTCGIRLGGVASVKLHLTSNSTQDFQVNLHKRLMLPVDLTIPLGAAGVPFNLTFSTAFTLDTGYSAKQSILNAEGTYSFSGGVWAGYASGQWSATAPSHITADTDLGRTVEGISVGINSLVMGASVRALVGVGAFGFNTGVYGGIRFSGTVLRAPVETFPCQQGTIDAFIDSGVGYSIPHWVTDAINLFLKPFTKHQIDPAGSFMKGPSFRLFSGNTQVPGGCATSKSGGS
jgi:hypothetical protein